MLGDQLLERALAVAQRVRDVRVHVPRAVSRIEPRHLLERFRDPRDNSVECPRDLHGYSFSSVGRSSHCKWSPREESLRRTPQPLRSRRTLSKESSGFSANSASSVKRRLFLRAQEVRQALSLFWNRIRKIG